MSAIIFQGVLLGLALSFMIGPLFFAVMQATLERGQRAGLAVSVGIWLSDLGFVLLVERALGLMTAVAASPAFRFWAGCAGGVLLIVFGLGSVSKRSKAPSVANYHNVEIGALWHLAVRGFVVNTFNPGTLVFWLGTATGIIAPKGWDDTQVAAFFIAMLAVLACTDLLKIKAAYWLKRWLTPQHTQWVQWSIGVLLTVFGAALLVEAFWRL
jgi:threonine/homoserine/homoserine lactone efflux protein